MLELATYALIGIDALPVEDKVDTTNGLQETILVGLPDTAVKLERSSHRTRRQLQLPCVSNNKHPYNGCSLIEPT